MTNNLCRHTTDNGVCWNITRYDGTGGDDRIFAYVDPPQDYSMCTYPHPSADARRFACMSVW